MTYHPLNVSSAESWESLLGSLKGNGNGKKQVDILVNCAGITQRSALMRTGVDEIQELVGTNLTGTVLGCKFVGRVMLKNPSRNVSRVRLEDGTTVVVERGVKGVNEKGVIVNVASLLAQKGVIGTSVYAAAKAGVVGKLLCTQRELTSN